MCWFCDEHGKIDDDRSGADGATLEFVADESLGPCLYVEAFCQCGYDGGNGYFSIDYCPFCGRRLSDD